MPNTQPGRCKATASCPLNYCAHRADSHAVAQGPSLGLGQDPALNNQGWRENMKSAARQISGMQLNEAGTAR